MRVILVSVGTDGDIFPYVGLGARLKSRGHQVTLAASAHYESLAGAHGFGFRALNSAAENDELFHNPDFWNPLKTAPLSARWGVRFIRRQYDLLSTMAAPDAVLVANSAVFAAGLVHEKFGVPLANLILQPWLVPSSIAPPIMPGFVFLRSAPRPVWQLFWRGLGVVVDRLVGRELNRVRGSLGLPPIRHIFKNWYSPQLILGLFPDWYGPPQADWPPQLRLTGFPVFDGGKGDELAPKLVEFCRAGEPPVAFTFGTGMAHSAKLFQAALDACERLGRRGIFLTKFTDQLPQPLPATIFHSAFAPFQKLFPLCAAIVHHGGIGTTAQALAAGVPQLICPICFDQIDNGARTKRLGVGDWLKPRRINGRNIANTLKKLLIPETQSRCRAMMKRFENTDAFALAAAHIENFAVSSAGEMAAKMHKKRKI